jgi:hypothetical protein
MAPVIVLAATHYYNVVQIGGCEWQAFKHIDHDCLEDTRC